MMVGYLRAKKVQMAKSFFLLKINREAHSPPPPHLVYEVKKTGQKRVKI